MWKVILIGSLPFRFALPFVIYLSLYSWSRELEKDFKLRYKGWGCYSWWWRDRTVFEVSLLLSSEEFSVWMIRWNQQKNFRCEWLAGSSLGIFPSQWFLDVHINFFIALSGKFKFLIDKGNNFSRVDKRCTISTNTFNHFHCKLLFQCWSNNTFRKVSISRQIYEVFRPLPNYAFNKLSLFMPLTSLNHSESKDISTKGKRFSHKNKFCTSI